MFDTVMMWICFMLLGLAVICLALLIGTAYYSIITHLWFKSQSFMEFWVGSLITCFITFGFVGGLIAFAGAEGAFKK